VIIVVQVEGVLRRDHELSESQQPRPRIHPAPHQGKKNAGSGIGPILRL